jgi:hypothetical protein
MGVDCNSSESVQSKWEKSYKSDSIFVNKKFKNDKPIRILIDFSVFKNQKNPIGISLIDDTFSIIDSWIHDPNEPAFVGTTLLNKKCQSVQIMITSLSDNSVCRPAKIEVYLQKLFRFF